VRRIQDALDAYDLADRSAAAAHDIDGQIQAICAKGNTLIFMAKDAAGCQEQCRRAFELAQGQGSSESLAAVDMVRYLERICAGDFNVALECYEHALPVLREKGLSPANLLGLNMRAALHIWRGETAQAIEVLDWALDKARAVGDLPRIVQNQFLRAMSLGRQGRLGEALDVTREAQHLGELTGERVQVARFPNTLGWLHRELQDLEVALKLDLEGIRLTQEIGEKEADEVKEGADVGGGANDGEIRGVNRIERHVSKAGNAEESFQHEASENEHGQRRHGERNDIDHSIFQDVAEEDGPGRRSFCIGGSDVIVADFLEKNSAIEPDVGTQTSKHKNHDWQCQEAEHARPGETESIGGEVF